MATKKQLSDAVKATLGGLGGYNHDLYVTSAAGKKARLDCAYEAYIFSLVIEALQSIPSPPTLTVQSTSTNVFHVRRAPGSIKNSPNPYSYIEIDHNGTEYELHLDTYVETLPGGARLEADVLILRKTGASTARNAGDDPKKNYLKLAIEVKCLSKKLGTGRAKEFLGLDSQFKGSNRHISIATNQDLTSNAETLITQEKLKPYKFVSPVAANATDVSQMINDLAAELQTIL